MPSFQHIEKADLGSATLDLETLAPYITSLEGMYGAPDSGALILTLDEDETKREVGKNLKNAFKVLQARNGNVLPDNALVVKSRGQKIVVSIERTPPAKVARPRKAKKEREAVTA